MPKFAANISMLYRDLPVLDRITAAAEAGFKAVEILFPYNHAVVEITHALRMNGLKLALINCPPPNWTGGPRGFAADPDLVARFQHDFKRALRFAKALGAQRMHIMAGVAEGPEAHATFVSNLKWAAREAKGFDLTIEPINTVDMPGYFLCDFDQAAAILDEVFAPNLSLQFDAYHAHLINGDVIGTWEKHGHRATHIQIADAPGRHEIGTGEIDFETFFDRVDRSPYRGFVSAEYNPTHETSRGLGWLKRFDAV